MKRRSTPQRGTRTPSPHVRAKSTGRTASNSTLPVTARRRSRLDGVLQDSRESRDCPQLRTPRSVSRQPATRASKNEHAARDHLRDVYDRVEQRNNGSAPRLSAPQLLLAEQAAKAFVAKIRRTAAMEVTQAKKTELLQALDAEIVLLRSGKQQFTNDESSLRANDVKSWYVAGKEVGCGTFGCVRLATHRLSGTPVAIKSYTRLQGSSVCLSLDATMARASRDSGGDALEWQRVRREVNVLSKVRPHPNLVRFVEAFETPTRMHVVTEIVRGSSLCDVLQRSPGQRFTETRARRVFRQLVDAVEDLHAQRVIHRDLKLENVLLNERSGHATVIDFGFSDFEDTLDESVAETDLVSGSGDPVTKTKLAKKKNFCGTPSYMAPEVVACARYDGRPVDVWNLGVLLYVMLCGKFPFLSSNFHQLYQRLRSGAQQLLLPPSLSTGVRALLQILLTVEPTKRPSARELQCHSWLQESDTSMPTSCLPLQVELSLVAAFAAWPGTIQAVCAALQECYGLSLDSEQLELLVQPRKKMQKRRYSRVQAFLELAVFTSGQYFRRLVATMQSMPQFDDAKGPRPQGVATKAEDTDLKDTPNNSPEMHATSSTGHKQQLEKLIGLVKLSLAASN